MNARFSAIWVADRPVVRESAEPADAGHVDRCDLMLVTHGHDDHLGNALQVASRTRPAWPAIHELSLWLARHYAGKDAVIGMNKGGTVEAAGIRVTMVHADHSAGDWNAGGETTLYLGEPAGFVVELEDGDAPLPRRRHRRVRRHAADRRALPARPRDPADRRALHDGPADGGPRGRAASACQARPADPLRDVPDPGRDAGPSSLGAGRRGARRRDGPRTEPGDTIRF